jgi:tetratricopeptide (TPR) repeat protein
MLRAVARASHRNGALRVEIERLFDGGEWSRARWILEQLLRDSPHDHWLHMQIALTFFEDRQLDKAWEAIERAVALAPECPQVLWYRAGILHELGRLDDAVQVYRAIVERGPERWTGGGCGLRIALARGLVSDSWRRLFDIHEARGEKEFADLAYEQHLDMLGPGCYGLYTFSVTSGADPEAIRRNLRMRTTLRKPAPPPSMH